MPDLAFRDAIREDLPAIVGLLNDDSFGQARNPLFEAEAARYRTAFDEILADPNNGYLVAVRAGQIIGCTQLTFIRGLSYTGGLRAQVESVRVASALRGRGIGAALMQACIDRARQRGCVLVQLTTDVRREQTRRFYERLGFAASHHGMKLRLE